MQCPRHSGNLTLSEAACAAMWRRGKTAEPGDAVFLCQGCPIGAGHAGEALTAPAVPLPKVCPRCGRPCGGTTGRRMVVTRGICVSCYNREREIAIGRDRRGHMPQAPARLPVLSILCGGEPVMRASIGLVELSLWALRSRQDATAVSRAPMGTEIAARLAQQQREPLMRSIPHGGPMQMGLWPGIDYRKAGVMGG